MEEALAQVKYLNALMYPKKNKNCMTSLLHNKSLIIVWKLPFFPFLAPIGSPGLVREMLLGWKSAFVGKRRKKVWQAAPSCLLWIVWKARNRIVFKEDILSIQKLKYLFLLLLWSETKLSIESGPSTLVVFID